MWTNITDAKPGEGVPVWMMYIAKGNGGERFQCMGLAIMNIDGTFTNYGPFYNCGFADDSNGIELEPICWQRAVPEMRPPVLMWDGTGWKAMPASMREWLQDTMFEG